MLAAFDSPSLSRPACGVCSSSRLRVARRDASCVCSVTSSLRESVGQSVRSTGIVSWGRNGGGELRNVGTLMKWTPYLRSDNDEGCAASASLKGKSSTRDLLPSVTETIAFSASTEDSPPLGALGLDSASHPGSAVAHRSQEASVMKGEGPAPASAGQSEDLVVSLQTPKPIVSIPERSSRSIFKPHHQAMMQGDTDAVPQLPEELNPMLLPKHVAIIMDGNSRWAERKGWPASMGHEAGVQSLKEVVKLADAWGIEVLTVFAFSTENWLRPKMEIDFLMSLFEKVLRDELSVLAKENIRVHCMGDLTLLPNSLRNMITKLEETTRHNTGLKFSIALSYSGRQDIAGACQRLATKVRDGELSPADMTEAAIEQELKTSWVGAARDPDLLIRTSGEQRLSNFMLWQTAYSEFHFVDSLWPDFGEVQFKEALLVYQNRSRRFGKRK